MTVVKTRVVGVPDELLEKADWPEYPPPGQMTYGDAVILAEEFKTRWIGCRIDKDKIAELPIETEGQDVD